MKKTIYVWLIIVFFILSVAIELLALTSLPLRGLRSYYGNHAVLNIIAVVLLLLDIAISLFYLYKLFLLKKDVVLWTDIILGYAVLRGIFTIIADVISSKGTAVANSIEIIIILIIWKLFRKHLKKILGITGTGLT
ncbi:MAG: hypothetical protein NTU54_01630 [Candidatus Omnitrophica bacterium]|nr:hypothetical protein [Candidatus Omnitrophota bacterium]